MMPSEYELCLSNKRNLTVNKVKTLRNLFFIFTIMFNFSIVLKQLLDNKPTTLLN